MQPTFQLQNCPIFLGSLGRDFSGWLESKVYSQVLVLVDEQTKRHCLPYFLEAGRLHGKVSVIEIVSGESAKNLVTCEKIWQTMLSAQIDRKTLLVNLGGGVIGDMGGFCAAVWKRGIDFIQIPTTLLSMTDASIGGKTGIDFQGIKNIIGTFQQPAAVFIDPVFLQTLPARELRSGYAEVLKHALIGDPILRVQLSTNFKLSDCSGEAWLQILQKSIAVKVRVVQEDPYEKDLRMILNFGHTIGHAIESWFLETAQPLTHGEAIYIGMICESNSIPRKTNSRDIRSEVRLLGQAIFPKQPIPNKAFSAIWNLMQQDKKNSSGKVRMALPDEKSFSLQIIEPAQIDVERCLSYYNSLDLAQVD